MTRGPKRMTRRRAERLLERRASPGDHVATVVDAAAAPGTPAELSREPEALVQFRAAVERATAAADARPAPVLRGARRFTTRVGIATAAMFAAVTGLAVAAGAGVLPNRLQQPAHDLFHAPAPSGSTPSPQPTSTTTPRPSRTRTTGSSSSATQTSPTSTVPTNRTPGNTTARPSTSTVPSSEPSPPTSSSPTMTTTPVSSKPTRSTSPAPSKTKKSKSDHPVKATHATSSAPGHG
jgi:hypothetical protein